MVVVEGLQDNVCRNRWFQLVRNRRNDCAKVAIEVETVENDEHNDLL